MWENFMFALIDNYIGESKLKMVTVLEKVNELS